MRNTFLAWFVQSLALAANLPVVTPPAAGPYHLKGVQIVDSAGREFLIRGTELPVATLNPADIAGDSAQFGPFSASAFATLRHRMNANAVRLPVDAALYVQNKAYRDQVAKIVHQANRFELLVIIGAEGSSVSFWPLAASEFKNNPNVLLNLHEIPIHYATLRADLDRAAALAAKEPIVVTGFDPELDRDSGECAAFPSDPAAATKLVDDTLTFLDTHHISWILSSMRAGRLVTDYRSFDWTKLDDGWTCGQQNHGVGIAMVVLSHLWHADPHGLFAVHQNRGGFVLARGAVSTAYGPILADREMDGITRRPLPTQLGNVSIRITDSRGVARLAPLLHTGAGWAFISYVVPPECALGPAEVAIVRTDGSISPAHVVIADVAPGLWTAPSDGRGPVIAKVQQPAAFDAWKCAAYDCHTLPILLSPGIDTIVRLEGTGFRNAKPNADVRVWMGDVPVKVLSFGATQDFDRDQITVRIPDRLQNAGEVDVVVTVNGIPSNVARINFARAPRLPVPAANPISAAKVRLGRYLFYDRRMSVNGSTSCATCHHQELAFTDGKAHPRGATGDQHPRSAMSLVNAGYNTAFNWSDPTVHSLEDQALKPMFSTTPVELGVVETRFLDLARSDAVYQPLFSEAFPKEANPYTIANVAKAIAAFERTMVSANSPYDRFHAGDNSAISESAKRGEILFFLDGGPSCFRCHGGFNFSDTTEFHNTGLYNPYPEPSLGIFDHTNRPDDLGKFKAPTLRNIALTAPYMHDGSAATLEDVLDHYAAGGRAVGHDNPNKDKLMRGFPMTRQNRIDLIAFLKSLTDQDFITDPRFSDPWVETPLVIQ